MDSPLEIAFVGSETRPFEHRSEVGAFADALGRELERRGHFLVYFLPDGEYLSRFPGLRFQDSVDLDVSGRKATLRRGSVEGRTARFVAIGGEELESIPPADVAKSAVASAFFAKGVLTALHEMKWRPHVFHVLDPSAALLPVLLRRDSDIDPEIRNARTLYSIHDLSGAPYGSGDAWAAVGSIGQDPEVRASVDMNGGASFLRAALLYADRVTAPGPAYAAELQRQGYGFGFEDVLAQKGDRLEGIPFGIDTSRWNPLSDELIPYRFSSNDLVQRGSNKVRLLESLDLPVEPDVPLLTFDALLADGQGWELLEAVAGDLLGERVKLALFGRRVAQDAVSKWETWAEDLAKAAPDNVSFVRDASEPQFRLELAGTDFLLCTPRREPTAQLAMRGMRYGAVPIAHLTGALMDVVHPYVLETGKGEGFVFEGYDGGAMLTAIRQAIEVYPKRSAWKRLVARLQQIEVSWSRTATRYIAAYERTVVMPPAR
ncbi:MAG: glycogen/starch synthase [Candidatus Eisenbacteria bacterium]|uniref:starch synthase n=1 Tax=Eiseniibacteriota bacterium TaxID=2212470 RepID=A0A956SFK9_UNCEI|nr:glycogen/starch synthase [Candidatus Eisenbacteria bacterium]MCB9462383.1 glycogen/starch synthase [Candidatus Eisenbacteria bacterium]